MKKKFTFLILLLTVNNLGFGNSAKLHSFNSQYCGFNNNSYIYCNNYNANFVLYNKQMSYKRLDNVYIDKDILRIEIPYNTEAGCIQLFTHGRPGELLINGEWKNAEQIAEFLTVNYHLSTFNHLNIYGCEFAKGIKGHTAVQYLENTLGISVAASTNITGKGGDWILEVGYPKGNIEIPAYEGSLQYGASDDFDADGIINSIDLDDDNDGILDASECPLVEGATSSFQNHTAASSGTSGSTSNSNQNTCTNMNPGDALRINDTMITAMSFPTYRIILQERTGVTGSFVFTNVDTITWTELTSGNFMHYIKNTAVNGFRISIFYSGAGAFGHRWGVTCFKKQTNCDLDSDGIPNEFDLDSDNDGCVDAIEGGAGFTSSNISGGKLTGGVNANGIPQYTPLPSNYSNTTGQTVGTSQNAASYDINCPCIAGSTAPSLTSTSLSNFCPDTTVNLNSLFIGTPPSGTRLVWSTVSNATSATDTITTPTKVKSGTYYAYFYSPSFSCFSPSSVAVQVSTTSCIVIHVEVGTVTSALGGIAIADITDNDSVNGKPAVIGTNATVSISGVWPSGITLNTSTGAISVTPGTPPGTYPVTYELCDKIIPPTCVTIVDTVFVTAVSHPDTITVKPKCPTCAVTICATKDDLTTPGPVSYYNCGLDSYESTLGSSSIDINGCYNWRGNSTKFTTSITTCIIACNQYLCDTTFIIIQKPIAPDTIDITLACDTCSANICTTDDDIAENNLTHQRTYSTCNTPTGIIKTGPDMSGCYNYKASTEADASSTTCQVGCINGECDTTYIILARNMSPLPIELIQFRAALDQDNVVLTWTTASEISNNYFSIERSTDALNYEEIGKVSSKSQYGNSNEILNYSFIDNEIQNSLLYYRLKQYDYDGKFTYSNIISIKLLELNDENSIVLYPNPTKTNISFQFSRSKVSLFNIEIFDILGKYYGNSNLYSYSNQNINLSNLPSGIYFIKFIFDDNNVLVKKIIKE